jgi:hypothetical protein
VVEKTPNPSGLTCSGKVTLIAVQTLTAGYDPVEDQICPISGEASGAKQAIDLTQGRVDQIILVVSRHFEGKTPKGVPSKVVQSMIRERVRQTCKAQPPAEALQGNLETPRGRCMTIQIQNYPASFSPSLSGDACEGISLLDNLHLRSERDTFGDRYTQTAWHFHLFPDWYEPEKPADAKRGYVRFNRRINLRFR